MAFLLGGLTSFGELQTELESKRDNPKAPPTLRINKKYLRLYQMGFLITQTVILIGIIYILVIKPFRDGLKSDAPIPI